jgi:hypothetical protein
MLTEIPKLLYLLVPIGLFGLFFLIYLGKIESIDIKFLGNILKIVAK